MEPKNSEHIEEEDFWKFVDEKMSGPRFCEHQVRKPGQKRRSCGKKAMWKYTFLRGLKRKNWKNDTPESLIGYYCDEHKKNFGVLDI